MKPHKSFEQNNPNFWSVNVLVCCGAGNQSSKLQVSLKSFQTKLSTLKVIETKITSEYASNGYYYGTEGKQKSVSDKNLFFCVFLKICDPCFNP